MTPDVIPSVAIADAPTQMPLSAPVATTAVVASNDAKRVAGTILEVLAGVRSITDAALGLGITAARYYALEARAVAGLIAACEPRGPGPQTGHGLQAEVDRLRGERDRLRDEAARYQALARIAQTAFGPPCAPPPTPAYNSTSLPGLTVRQQRAARAAARNAPVPSPAAKPRKKRIPTVRALRLARQVQHHASSPSAAGAATPAAPAGG